jgi:hypothetical protein
MEILHFHWFTKLWHFSLSPSGAGDNLVVCYPLVNVNWFPLQLKVPDMKSFVRLTSKKVYVVILSLSWNRLLLKWLDDIRQMGILQSIFYYDMTSLQNPNIIRKQKIIFRSVTDYFTQTKWQKGAFNIQLNLY